MLLEVRNINTYRGPAHILRDVSIDVDSDEVVALVGRNGAGRTTMIESITGLLPVRSGQIRFRQQEITSLPAHRRAKRGIGYAPENSGIFPELTVAENLMISRWLSARTERGNTTGSDTEEGAFRVFPEVRALLSRQGLNLSGGQKKMVAIARAMGPRRREAVPRRGVDDKGDGHLAVDCRIQPRQRRCDCRPAVHR